MKDDDKTNEVITTTIKFNETLTQVTLTIGSETPMDFEFYKQALFDFVQDCDANGKDLFYGDDCSTLLN